MHVRLRKSVFRRVWVYAFILDYTNVITYAGFQIYVSTPRKLTDQLWNPSELIILFDYYNTSTWSTTQKIIFNSITDAAEIHVMHFFLISQLLF